MRISLFRKIYTFAFSSCIILLILVISILWAYQKVEMAYTIDSYAQKINNHASALRILALNDNIFSEQYNLSPWQNEQNKLTHLFVNAPALTAKLQTIQNSIKSQSTSANSLISQVNLKKTHLKDEAFKKHLRAKIITLLDVMHADANQLSGIAHKNINEVVKQQVVFILLILSIGILSLFIGACKLINIFKITHTEIKKTFKENFGGNFKEIVLSNHFEEFENIALEFNKMLNKLNDTRVVLEERTRLLEQLSNTDPLTKVGNRRYLFTRGAVEFSRARRTKSDLTILLLDCDYFKKINDKFGHLFGDDTLKVICSICHNEIRDIDCLTRYGGEEFILILPDCNLQGGLEIAKRIQHSLAQYELICAGEKVKVTLSIGVCTLDNQHKDFDQLISAADRAMYQAKKNGRNRIEVFSREQSNTPPQ